MNHVFSQPTAKFLIEAINCHPYQTLIIRASMVCVAAPQCVVPDGILTVFNTFPASSVFFSSGREELVHILYSCRSIAKDDYSLLP